MNCFSVKLKGEAQSCANKVDDINLKKISSDPRLSDPSKCGSESQEHCIRDNRNCSKCVPYITRYLPNRTINKFRPFFLIFFSFKNSLIPIFRKLSFLQGFNVKKSQQKLIAEISLTDQKLAKNVQNAFNFRCQPLIFLNNNFFI